MIGPIRQLYFQCDGCGAQWMLHVDPPITSAQELIAFTKSSKMEPCPKKCGATTCSLLFKLGRVEGADPNAPRVDPFSIFSKPKEQP